MLRQVLINLLFYTGLPVSLLVFAAGMWRKRAGWGFVLGFIPLVVMWLLLSPDLFPVNCPEPCMSQTDELALVLGASLLHLVFYTAIAAGLYVINRYLLDPETAVIKQLWQKMIILFQTGLLGLVAACLVALNTALVYTAVVDLGRIGLAVASHRWFVISCLIAGISAAGVWVVYRLYRASTGR